MSTTINVICYKFKVLKNNENPLMLRVTKDRKSRYLSLGISINPQFWDFEKNKPKTNCPHREEIQQIVIQKTKEYQGQVLEYKIEDKDFTAKSLIEKVKNPVKAKTVKEAFELYIKLLKEADAYALEYILNSFPNCQYNNVLWEILTTFSIILKNLHLVFCHCAMPILFRNCVLSHTLSSADFFYFVQNSKIHPSLR